LIFHCSCPFALNKRDLSRREEEEEERERRRWKASRTDSNKVREE
jgi:hypothetical protein